MRYTSQQREVKISVIIRMTDWTWKMRLGWFEGKKWTRIMSTTAGEEELEYGFQPHLLSVSVAWCFCRGINEAHTQKAKWNKQITNVRHIWYIIKIYDEQAAFTRSCKFCGKLDSLHMGKSPFESLHLHWLRCLLLGDGNFGNAIISGIKRI